ncbi:tetratricopeptide repeat protein [Breznakiellaceae bacterium SP9]
MKIVLYIDVSRIHVPDFILAETKRFTVDPCIPLPVELDDAQDAADLSKLSWEQLVSGMLKVIADPPLGLNIPPMGMLSEKHIEYYRNLVLAVKPAILRDFTVAAVFKAENGQHDLALEICRMLEGLFPDSPLVRLNRTLILETQGKALAKQGQEQEAALIFDQVRLSYEECLDDGTTGPDAYFHAGSFFLYRQDYQRARDCFSTFLSISQDPKKRLEVEELLRDLADSKLDDEAYRQAYRLVNQGCEQEGLVYIRDFIERYPTVWNGWFLLGWALRRLGRFDDGAAAFRKAIELGASGADCRNELAICLMEKGELKEARAELERALRHDPENAKIISNLGVLAARAGDAKEADGFFRTVLELAPGDQLALRFLKDRL